MKSVLLLLLVLSVSLQASLIKSASEPSQALDAILDVVESERDWSVFEANDALQAHFLRKKGEMRYEMRPVAEESRKVLLPHLKDLGVLDAVLPSKRKYDIILVHGATIEGMRKRVSFLNTLWKYGLRAEKIVFLTSNRLLDEQREPLQALYLEQLSSYAFCEKWLPSEGLPPFPRTECEAAKLVWDQIACNATLRKIPVHFAAAYEMIDDNGQRIHANTRDTIKEWVKRERPSGSILAISSNPFVPYQDVVLKIELDKLHYFKAKKNTVETVGPASPIDTLIAVHLDNIARWLYNVINQ